jgi:hypothetical protein
MMSAHDLILFQQEQSLTGGRKWSFSAITFVQREEKRSTLVQEEEVSYTQERCIRSANVVGE